MEIENRLGGEMATCGGEDRQGTRMARVAAGVRMGFYYHLAVYVTVNLLLTVISLKLTPGFFWVMWMAMGWGIGIIVHGLSALFLASPLSRENT